MTSPKWVKDHWWLIKTTLPWIAGFWTIIITLVGAGWVDVPARSQDVIRLTQAVESQSTQIKVLGRTTRDLRESDARQQQQNKDIQRQLNTIEGQLDRLLDHALENRRRRQ